MVLRHANVYNALYILAEATHLHAEQLAERLQCYLTVNMELFLDSGMLDDIPAALVKLLSRFARQKQVEKSSISRSNILAQKAMTAHAEWLALQDIPSTIVRTTHPSSRKSFTNVKLSPSGHSRKTPRPPISPLQSPIIQPARTIRRHPSGDDIFTMDDADALPPLILDQPQYSTPGSTSSNVVANPSPVWKAPSVPRYVEHIILGFFVTNPLSPRVDMKTVMAEAASAAGTQRPRELHRPLSSKSLHDPSYTQLPPSHTALQIAQAKPSPRMGSSPRPLAPLTPPRPSRDPPGLGRVITPTRQPSASNIRRTS